ncbi:hypothetical protein HanPI659440_Chr14g0546641 [Helianthus annuus]|nr:hypothetical protein HanPI659440_Chr14g0546641 [Helianthus annuus]
MDQTDHGCEECLRGREGKTAYGIYVAMNQQIIKARSLASEDSGSLTNCGYDDGTVRDVTRRAYSSRT